MLVLCISFSVCIIIYSVSQTPPLWFYEIFPKRLGIFNQFLHTYYVIISKKVKKAWILDIALLIGG